MLEPTPATSSFTVTNSFEEARKALDEIHQAQSDRLAQWSEDQVIKQSGTYAALVESFKAKKPAPPDHILAGHPVYNVRVQIQHDGRTYTQFHDCTMDRVRNPNNQYRPETVVGLLLSEATDTVGQPAETTLEAAVGQTFHIRLSYTEPEDGYKPRNWINGVTKAT